MMPMENQEESMSCGRPGAAFVQHTGFKARDFGPEKGMLLLTPFYFLHVPRALAKLVKSITST